MFSKEFYPMIDFFLWQLIGDFFKIMSWILAFIMVAKSMTKLYIITEIIFSLLFQSFINATSSNSSIGIGFANKNLSYYTTSAVLPATEPLSGTPGFPQCTLCRFLRCLSENLTFLYTASVRISDHSKQLYPSIGQFTCICPNRHMAVSPCSL